MASTSSVVMLARTASTAGARVTPAYPLRNRRLWWKITTL
jgi:hypothetical protein